MQRNNDGIRRTTHFTKFTPSNTFFWSLLNVESGRIWQKWNNFAIVFSAKCYNYFSQLAHFWSDMHSVGFSCTAHKLLMSLQSAWRYQCIRTCQKIFGFGNGVLYVYKYLYIPIEYFYDDMAQSVKYKFFLAKYGAKNF